MAFLLTRKKSAILRQGDLATVINLPSYICLDILMGQSDDYQSLNQLIEAQGINSSSVGQLIIFKYILPDEDTRAVFEKQRRSIQSTLESSLGEQSQAIVGFVSYLGGAEFMLLVFNQDNSDRTMKSSRALAVSLTANLKKQADFEIAVGLEDCGATISEQTVEAYQACRQAICIGYGIWQRHYVYSLDDFELMPVAYRGLSDQLIAKSRYLLEQLERHNELLETMATYFDHDMNLTLTASALDVHRNTVLYRFGKIVELTDGLDPRNFDDAVQLRLAVMISGLQS